MMISQLLLIGKRSKELNGEGLTVTKTTKPESFFNDYPFADDQPPRTEAQIKLEKIKRAKETKLNDIARREERAKAVIKVGKPVPQKTAQTQAQRNLEAAKTRGMAAGPVDEAAEYALKDAAGYFDDSYFDSFADDIVSESYEVLDSPVASISSSVRAAATSSGATTASIVSGKAPTATRASATLSSAVSKGGKNAHLNLKTAAAAAGLGLAGGYFANRKRTRR